MLEIHINYKDAQLLRWYAGLNKDQLHKANLTQSNLSFFIEYDKISVGISKPDQGVIEHLRNSNCSPPFQIHFAPPPTPRSRARWVLSIHTTRRIYSLSTFFLFFFNAL